MAIASAMRTGPNFRMKPLLSLTRQLRDAVSPGELTPYPPVRKPSVAGSEA